MVAFAPPLTTTAAEVDEIIDIFEAALAETLAAH
jgi:4-aminobutyrate aminotransferase-like enzyme